MLLRLGLPTGVTVSGAGLLGVTTGVAAIVLTGVEMVSPGDPCRIGVLLVEPGVVVEVVVVVGPAPVPVFPED